MRKISLPLTDKVVKSLHAGDMVYLNGIIYSARDAAHLRLMRAIERGDRLPIELKGQTIYYMGPSPAKPGRAVGSAGPTSADRMDKTTPILLDRGLKAMIGKGKRSMEVIDSMKKNTAVYFVAVGGTAALISERIHVCEPIAYLDLGAEAIHELHVEDFPVTVAIDCYGENQYEKGVADYLATQKA